MLRTVFSFIAAILFGTTFLQAQTVGVVMSGGGAKGLYHIGVLEALEQNGIPIDCVAGTSMGSVIAAMYAAGYSPAEMRAIVASGVIKDWISGRIDPNYMPYYRRLGMLPAFLRLRVDVSNPEPKRRFALPTNLISSTPIDMALLELFAPATAASKGDFDHLMVPFLCVASDMNAGKPAVLRNGDLAEAVRSSMSIPLVFKPMKRDSMLLYDGGIFDNFPWQPLDTDFKPDVILGSVCTEGNIPPSENNNLMEQAFMLAMHETNYDLPEGRSVMVRRAVTSSMLDFDNAVAIIDMGYADAMMEMPKIRAAINARCDSTYYVARRKAFRERCAPLIFDDYHISGLSRMPATYVRDFVKIDYKHLGRQHKMTYDQLKANLYSMLAAGDFSMEFPQAIYNPTTQRYSFEAKLTTKPSFQMTIGGNVSSTAFNQAFIGVSYETIGRVAHTLTTDLYLGPIYSWGSIGGRADFYMWKPLFLDYSYKFSVKNLRHGTFGNVSDVDNALQVKNSESFFSLCAGMPLTRSSVLYLRANAGHINYRYDSDVVDAYDTDHSRFSYFGLKLGLERNTLDRQFFPRKGSHLTFSGVFVTGRDKYKPYNKVDFLKLVSRQWFGARFTWDKYFNLSPGSWFSLGVNFDAVYTNHPDFTTQISTLMSMPSYEPIPQAKMIYMPDFYARRFVAGGVIPTFDLLPNFCLRTGFYAMYRDRRDFSPLRKLSVGDFDEQMHYIVEASFVYHTQIGPVSLSLTKYGLRNWRNMYLTFNFGYAIFAPRGTFY